MDQVKERKERKHGKWLLLWLAFIFIINFFGSLILFFSLQSVQKMPQMFLFGSVALGITTGILVLFLYEWKKWAFYGICATYALGVVLSVAFYGLGSLSSLIGSAVGIGILYVLLKPEWDLLE